MSAEEIVTLYQAELVSPRERGGRIRAYCPIHGGDHQRSLSIATDGEVAGYGFCHTCHARVFVPELAQDTTRRPRRSARPTAETLLRPTVRQAPDEPTPEPWQRKELEALTSWYPRMRERLADDRARAYLEERGIPWEIADGAGVGYIPANARLSGGLAKWRDRLVFPLGSAAGTGYAGRSLHGWQPGMDENMHKALLEADPASPRRWEKTYPAGWWNYAALAHADYAVLVEGTFDALALQAAGLLDAPVIALIGTAGRAEWPPNTVVSVILALDYDKPEVRQAARNLAYDLRMAGIAVTLCAPPQDGNGKDWSERWRLAEWEGVAPVFDALDALMASSEPPHTVTTSAVETRNSASLSAEESKGDDTAPWLADPVMRFLLAQGYELAEARLVG